MVELASHLFLENLWFLTVKCIEKCLLYLSKGTLNNRDFPPQWHQGNKRKKKIKRTTKWLYFKGQTTEMRKQWVNDMTGKENVGAASRTQSHFSGLPAPCCPFLASRLQRGPRSYYGRDHGSRWAGGEPGRPGPLFFECLAPVLISFQRTISFSPTIQKLKQIWF